MTCKWSRYPAWCAELWQQYVVLHKRGGVPLHEGAPEMLDVAQMELAGEAERARKRDEVEAQRAFLKQRGLM